MKIKIVIEVLYLRCGNGLLSKNKTAFFDYLKTTVMFFTSCLRQFTPKQFNFFFFHKTKLFKRKN